MPSTMRVALLAVAAMMAGLTSAQGSLPSCATDCVTQFTSGSSIGGCSNIDIACVCSSQDFLGGIACCLAGKCDQADQDAATSYAQNICKIAGVTNLPTAVSCTATASSTAASSATGAVTSSASSVQSSVSSSASKVSSVSSVVSSIAATVSGLAGSSTSSSASTSATNNAGPHNAAGLGAGVLGGLAAAVALL